MMAHQAVHVAPAKPTTSAVKETSLVAMSRVPAGAVGEWVDSEVDDDSESNPSDASTRAQPPTPQASKRTARVRTPPSSKPLRRPAPTDATRSRQEPAPSHGCVFHDPRRQSKVTNSSSSSDSSSESGDTTAESGDSSLGDGSSGAKATDREAEVEKPEASESGSSSDGECEAFQAELDEADTRMPDAPTPAAPKAPTEPDGLAKLAPEWAPKSAKELLAAKAWAKEWWQKEADSLGQWMASLDMPSPAARTESSLLSMPERPGKSSSQTFILASRVSASRLKTRRLRGLHLSGATARVTL